MTTTLPLTDRLNPEAVAEWKAARVAAARERESLERKATGAGLGPVELARFREVERFLGTPLCVWLDETRRNG